MNKTVVHVLRHGEVHNPAKILYGRLPDFHLSELGVQMAKLAAVALADHDITAVVASPLERAIETAEPIAEQFGLPIATDDGLLESTNFFEGKTFGVGDGALKYPRNWWVVRNPFRPSWGEPYRQVGRRMLAAVHRAREAALGHEAVCVSHQLPIWILRRYVEGRVLWHDPRRRQCALGSLTSLHFEDDRLTAVSYRDPSASIMTEAARQSKGA